MHFDLCYVTNFSYSYIEQNIIVNDLNDQQNYENDIKVNLVLNWGVRIAGLLNDLANYFDKSLF